MLVKFIVPLKIFIFDVFLNVGSRANAISLKKIVTFCKFNFAESAISSGNLITLMNTLAYDILFKGTPLNRSSLFAAMWLLLQLVKVKIMLFRLKYVVAMVFCAVEMDR